MVSVDEILKTVADTTRVKVNPQEPPFVYIATITQILLLPLPPPPITTIDTSSDTIQVPSGVVEKDTTTGPTRKISTSDSIV